jgi:hypothetical protein
LIAGAKSCLFQVFNTSLIVGYYWIPLTILCVLYGFIFEAAWRLSKKSADKERERQKLLALARKPVPGASNTAMGIAAVAMTASLATTQKQTNNGHENDEQNNQRQLERTNNCPDKSKQIGASQDGDDTKQTLGGRDFTPNDASRMAMLPQRVQVITAQTVLHNQSCRQILHQSQNGDQVD